MNFLLYKTASFLLQNFPFYLLRMNDSILIYFLSVFQYFREAEVIESQTVYLSNIYE